MCTNIRECVTRCQPVAERFGECPIKVLGVLWPIPLVWVIFLSVGGRFILILKNLSDNTVIAEEMKVADSFFKRLRGLMFTKELPSKSGLLITPCSEIHTFFMNYCIDVLYLDIHYKILAIDEDMQPGKIGKLHKGAVAVVELSTGRVKETCLKVGQTVELVKEGEELM